MNEFFQQFRTTTPFQVFVHVVDILIVAYVNYRILKLIRGTRAWRVVGGLLIFVGALFVSDFLKLTTLHWLLEKAAVLAPVVLALLLLPELRQALEGVAKLGLWPERLPGTTAASSVGADTIEEIVAAAGEMASTNTGALIVIERVNRLDDIAANGVTMDARVSAPLLGALFYHGNPLHDGAALVRQDRVIAAACRLPLSENEELDSHLHMRHRAAAGISEQSDALVIVVSEERGMISVALEGRVTPMLSNKELRDLLNREVRGVKPNEPRPPRSRLLRRNAGHEEPEAPSPGGDDAGKA